MDKNKKPQEPNLAEKGWSLTKSLMRYAMSGFPNVSEELFEKRMLIEASKIRLAFQLASLVQGGGAGGGRTISNADFEVI